jgi:hypothetical protein
MIARKPLALIVAAASVAAALLVGPAAHADTSLADAARILRLEAYESRSRVLPEPGKSHNYRFDTTPAFWSVVAAWSPPTGDVDLRLYDDKARTQLLGQSTFGTAQTDFIAVDGNHRPAGSYFPSVNRYGGTGTYFVEFAQGLRTLGSSPASVPMAIDDIVAVFDAYLVAGVTYTITLTPDNAAQDGDLFLVGSSSADPSTWVRSRNSSLASSTSHGVGQAESFSFTPSVSDYYGVVVVNEAAGGTFTLTRTT